MLLGSTLNCCCWALTMFQKLAIKLSQVHKPMSFFSGSVEDFDSLDDGFNMLDKNGCLSRYLMSC